MQEKPRIKGRGTKGNRRIESAQVTACTAVSADPVHQCTGRKTVLRKLWLDGIRVILPDTCKTENRFHSEPLV